MCRKIRVPRKEIDETKKQIVGELKEQLKMKIIGIIQKLNDVDPPEQNSYTFNYFLKKYRNDLEKLINEDELFTFR